MKKIQTILTATVVLVVLAVAASFYSHRVAAEPKALPSPQGVRIPADVIPPEARINPQELAQILKSGKGEKPVILYVGFRVLYSQAHIPGAENVGPAAKREGIGKLRKRAETLSKKKLVVIYCGCCPWIHCPNLGAAYQTLHRLGYTRLKALYIADNLGTDWVAKGYPIEKGM